MALLLSKVDCIGNCARLMHFIQGSSNPKIFFSNQIWAELWGGIFSKFQDDTFPLYDERPSSLFGALCSRAFKRIIWKDKCIHSSCDPYMDFELENTLLSVPGWHSKDGVKDPHVRHCEGKGEAQHALAEQKLENPQNHRFIISEL